MDGWVAHSEGDIQIQMVAGHLWKLLCVEACVAVYPPCKRLLNTCECLLSALPHVSVGQPSLLWFLFGVAKHVAAATASAGCGCSAPH